jgi:hypothetical protein
LFRVVRANLADAMEMPHRRGLMSLREALFVALSGVRMPCRRPTCHPGLMYRK